MTSTRGSLGGKDNLCGLGCQVRNESILRNRLGGSQGDLWGLQIWPARAAVVRFFTGCHSGVICTSLYFETTGIEECRSNGHK